MDGKVQSITTIFYFISYERESIAKLQFSATCFGLFGHHPTIFNIIGNEISSPITPPLTPHIV
jgi:hypothetical protein